MVKTLKSGGCRRSSDKNKNETIRARGRRRPRKSNQTSERHIFSQLILTCNYHQTTRRHLITPALHHHLVSQPTTTMSPTLWGLDLRQVHPAKFKSSYMWNNVYHLRRTKFIVYQLAMIFCVISESLGTAALSDYRDQAKEVSRFGGGGAEWSGDYIGVASYNIFNGIFVAFVFGAAFFFDLIFPERREDKGIRRAWKWCAVATCFTTLASAIAMSVIFATRSSRISGTPEQIAYITQRLRETGSDPLNYRENALAKASLAFLWPGWVACIAATWVLWKSDKWTVRNGPWSGSERRLREEEGCFDYPGLVQAGVPTNPAVNAAETQMEVETSSQTTLNPAVPPSTTANNPNVDLETGLNLKSSPANRLKPGQEGYDYHADKLADKGRGGGPTLRPSQVAAGVRRMGDKPKKEKVGAGEK
jgi:hypothetical protein